MLQHHRLPLQRPAPCGHGSACPWVPCMTQTLHAAAAWRQPAFTPALKKCTPPRSKHRVTTAVDESRSSHATAGSPDHAVGSLAFPASDSTISKQGTDGHPQPQQYSQHYIEQAVAAAGEALPRHGHVQQHQQHQYQQQHQHQQRRHQQQQQLQRQLEVQGATHHQKPWWALHVKAAQSSGVAAAVIAGMAGAVVLGRWALQAAINGSATSAAAPGSIPGSDRQQAGGAGVGSRRSTAAIIAAAKAQAAATAELTPVAPEQAAQVAGTAAPSASQGPHVPAPASQAAGAAAAATTYGTGWWRALQRVHYINFGARLGITPRLTYAELTGSRPAGSTDASQGGAAESTAQQQWYLVAFESGADAEFVARAMKQGLQASPQGEASGAPPGPGPRVLRHSVSAVPPAFLEDIARLQQCALEVMPAGRLEPYYSSDFSSEHQVVRLLADTLAGRAPQLPASGVPAAASAAPTPRPAATAAPAAANASPAATGLAAAPAAAAGPAATRKAGPPVAAGAGAATAAALDGAAAPVVEASAVLEPEHVHQHGEGARGTRDSRVRVPVSSEPAIVELSESTLSSSSSSSSTQVQQDLGKMLDQEAPEDELLKEYYQLMGQGPDDATASGDAARSPESAPQKAKAGGVEQQQQQQQPGRASAAATAAGGGADLGTLQARVQQLEQQLQQLLAASQQQAGAAAGGAAAAAELQGQVLQVKQQLQGAVAATAAARAGGGASSSRPAAAAAAGQQPPQRQVARGTDGTGRPTAAAAAASSSNGNISSGSSSSGSSPRSWGSWNANSRIKAAGVTLLKQNGAQGGTATGQPAASTSSISQRAASPSSCSNSPPKAAGAQASDDSRAAPAAAAAAVADVDSDDGADDGDRSSSTVVNKRIGKKHIPKRERHPVERQATIKEALRFAAASLSDSPAIDVEADDASDKDGDDVDKSTGKQKWWQKRYQALFIPSVRYTNGDVGFVQLDVSLNPERKDVRVIGFEDRHDCMHCLTILRQWPEYEGLELFLGAMNTSEVEEEIRRSWGEVQQQRVDEGLSALPTSSRPNGVVVFRRGKLPMRVGMSSDEFTHVVLFQAAAQVSLSRVGYEFDDF